MSRTINQLIAAAIDGGQEVDEASTPSAEVQEEQTKVASAVDLNDIEKLASACEYLGRTGIKLLLEKQASAAAPPSGTNDGQKHRTHVQSQKGPHAGAPPMKEPGFGKIPNNESQRPGGGSGSVDTAAQGKGSHHPSLSSNESAINYDKREKAKKVAPALASVLDTTAFGDGKLKENLSSAAGKGDKNIKKAYDERAIKAELARRAAAVGGA